MCNIYKNKLLNLVVTTAMYFILVWKIVMIGVLGEMTVTLLDL